MSFAPMNQQKRDFNANINTNTGTNKAASPGTSQQSFQKRTIPLDSPGSHQELNVQQTSTNNNPIMSSNANLGLQNRLEVIESHLNRVCNQHDALMPLLSLLETVPKINNNEQNMKLMQKKLTELEGKLEKLESQFNIKNNQHVFVQIERNFKNTSQQMTQMKNEMKEIQFSLGNNSKVAEAKLREEAQNVYRNVDVKIDRNKKDIQNLLAEFKNSISLSIKRSEDASQLQKGPNEGAKADIPEGFEKNIQEKVDGYIDVIQKQYERDMNNLYREIGMVRSELELIYDKGRRSYIFEEINAFPSDMDAEERKIAIANLEQSVFFEDIERFDKENQERLIYELDCLEDKIQQTSHLAMSNKNNQIDVKQEVNFQEDRFFSLKNQIHGTKKKYLIDVRKIEDRLEKLIIMKDQAIEEAKFRNQMPSHLQQNLLQIDDYPHRIEQLNDSISTNVEHLQARQKEIEEKLSLLKNIRS